MHKLRYAVQNVSDQLNTDLIFKKDQDLVNFNILYF